MNSAAARWLAFATLSIAIGAAVASPRAARLLAGIDLPATAPQGGLVHGRAPPGSKIAMDGRRLRQTADGRFVFGVGRDAEDDVVVEITPPGQAPGKHRIGVEKRSFRVERIDGVPPSTVTPSPAIAARIAREQAAVHRARELDDDRDDWSAGFTWPVRGRISGVFGSQRIYNGIPRAFHSGLDVAAAAGTPLRAPAPGVVTFAAQDLYLTGGTLLIDHGHGLSSNFLHLSRIDVAVGERVAQGQVIGAIGATGRATGPHMHWGMNWFDIRIDPGLLVAPGPE